MFRAKNENLDYLGDGRTKVSKGKLRRLFVGPNYTNYRNLFLIFDKNGVYYKTFNKAAAWLGIIWLLYRRLYIEAAIAFAAVLLMAIIVSLLAFPFKISFVLVAISFHIALGFLGNFIYWQKATKITERGFSYQDESIYAAHEMVKETGGVDIYSATGFAVVVFFLILILFL